MLFWPACQFRDIVPKDIETVGVFCLPIYDNTFISYFKLWFYQFPTINFCICKNMQPEFSKSKAAEKIPFLPSYKSTRFYIGKRPSCNQMNVVCGFFFQFQCFVNLKFKFFIFLQLLTKVYNFFMLLELRVWVPCRKSLYNWCNFIISIYIPDAIIYLRLYVILKCCKKGIDTTVITLWVVLLTTNQRSSSESCVCDCQLWEMDFVSILINNDC